MTERRRTTRPTVRHQPVAERPVAPRRWSALFTSERTTVAPPALHERDVAAAYERGELLVHYQLVVDRDHRPAGAEALLRWNRPGHGLVPASGFMNTVRSHELQRNITDLVIDDLVYSLPELRSIVRSPRPYFAMNAPAGQLQDSMFPSRIAAFLRAENIPADGVVVELTDPNEVTDWRAVRDACVELKRLDIDLAVDDAGADPGDLLYRDRTEAPVVKLDRSIVSESRRWEHERRVVEATVKLCKSEDLLVIAAGVEDGQTADWLSALGVDFQQGFHHGRPEPLDGLLSRVR